MHTLTDRNISKIDGGLTQIYFTVDYHLCNIVNATLTRSIQNSISEIQDVINTGERESNSLLRRGPSANSITDRDLVKVQANLMSIRKILNELSTTLYSDLLQKLDSALHQAQVGFQEIE